MMNKMEIKFSALTQNIIFARGSVSSFLLNLDLQVGIHNEIKTLVSEAVTNSIVHGYEEDETKEVLLKCQIEGNLVTIKVVDEGVGIDNIEEARKPLFSTKKELERSGLGFTILEAFCDELTVTSELGVGTTVICKKKI